MRRLLPQGPGGLEVTEAGTGEVPGSQVGRAAHHVMGRSPPTLGLGVR